MKCPQCSNSLQTIDYEGIKIETCRSCQGEWLDHQELAHITRAREARFTEEERRAIVKSTTIKGVILADVDRDLVCPKCGGLTDAINYGGNTGIIIDRCTKCQGIWLDEHELENIQTLVEGWEEQLPDDLKAFGAKLKKVAEDVDKADDVRVSRIGFVNSLINGLLDIMNV